MYNNDSKVTATTGVAAARAPGPVGSSSWYAKMATSWGAALDRQANKTIALSQQMSNGDDNPGVALQISAAAHQLSFLSTAASTTSNSIAQALETLGKKQ